MDSMNHLMGKLEMERHLWNESRTRDFQMVDFIIHPPARQRVSEGVPAHGMPRRGSAAALPLRVAYAEASEPDPVARQPQVLARRRQTAAFGLGGGIAPGPEQPPR